MHINPAQKPKVHSQAIEIVQLAYYVPDAKAAALRWAEHQGAGPFFVSENIPLSVVRYKGRLSSLDHTSAYGWCGGQMIELVQQNCATPSVFKEQRFGLHHCAYFCDSLKDETERLVGLGYEVAMHANTESGIEFAFIEGAGLPFGHYFEIYQDHPGLRAFYETIQEASAKWDGSDVLRSFS